MTFNPDYFQFQNRPEHIQYLMTNLLVEGKCEISGKQVIEAIDINVFSANDLISPNPVTLTAIGYWQLSLNPGEFPVQLASDLSRKFYIMRPSIISISTFARREFLLRPELKEGVVRIDFGATNFSYDGINILSIASGYFQEHLLKITILSILKNTKKVTFWLIQYFVSPKFKSMIASMALKFGFEYHLLSYSWPGWIRGQGDKWKAASLMKLVFLDVLLPLNLERIIFIEPGFIIRTDLKELINLNLDNFPYAFVELCNSKPEMSSFQPSKANFWKDFLKNRTYHISSLFIVDLPKFRKLAIGEMIRYLYQEMSFDPWTFGQLENDIPNILQEKQPGYSLGSIWSWCNIWCSDESIKEAKVIGACEMPGTKNRDLEFLRMNLPEWKQLEDEALKL